MAKAAPAERVAEYPPGMARTMVVTAAIIAAMLQLIDISIVNVSLREIAGSIGATTVEIAWVVTAYAVSNVIMIPLAGMFSDLFGRRNYFTASIIIFTAASAFCGMSHTLNEIIVWRFIQGLGGGGLLTSAQTIIVGAYPPEKISMANAIFGMGVMIGPTIGPTLGGWLTQSYSWHWIFLVNIPVGLLAGFLAWNYVHDRPGAVRPKKIDYWGIAFLVVGVSTLQYVLEEGAKDDWFNSTLIVVLSIISALGLILFVWWEWRTEHPAVNVRLVMKGNMPVGTILNGVLGLVLMGTVFVFPLFVQIGLGWTPLMTGMFMVPGAIATGISMGLVGRWLSKGVDPRLIMGIGVCIVVAFAFIMGSSSPGSSEGSFFWPFILRGVGMGMMMGPILTICLQGMQGADIGQASGITNMVRQIGGAAGIAGLNIFLTDRNAVHNTDLLAHVNIYDPATQDRLAAFTGGFLGQGFSLNQATMAGYQALKMTLFQQYSLSAYNDVFLLVAVLTALCLPLVFMVKYTKPQPGTKVEMAHE